MLTRGSLIFSLLCTRINGWVNNCEAGDLRRSLWSPCNATKSYVYHIGCCVCYWRGPCWGNDKALDALDIHNYHAEPCAINDAEKPLEYPLTFKNYPDSKVHGANMDPIGGRQDQGGPHVDPMNFAIWDSSTWIVVPHITAFWYDSVW